MRIQVVFSSTPILVPCGDGKLTVGELIQKAIVRFKKLGNKHPDDVIEVRSLRLADSGSFVDQDDEVCDVLEDKETVLLDFEFIPHYARDSGGGPSSLTDESVIIGSSQFSPARIVDDHAPYPTGDPHGHNEVYVHADSTANDLLGASQEHEHELHGHHDDTSHLEASQDTELVVGDATWHSSGESQEPSPHAGRKNPRWQDADSGYAPTKSQESYTHSQGKSQEVYTTDLSSLDGQSDYTLQAGNRDSLVLASSSQSSLTKATTRSLKKEDDTSSHKGYGDYSQGQKVQDPLMRGPEISKYGQRGVHDAFVTTPSRSIGVPQSRSGEYSSFFGSRGPEMSHMYHGSFQEGGDIRSLPGHPQRMDELSIYERERGRYPFDWRRSYHAGDYYHHDIPPYGRYDYHDPPHHMRGRFDRQNESLRSRHPQYRRIEESRMLHRARSHERMDPQASPYMTGRSPWEDYRDQEYFLSQPNPSYFGFDNSRPPYSTAPTMPFDMRQSMGGPSGYSLSQPGHMMSHGRMYDDRMRSMPFGGDRRGSRNSGSYDGRKERSYFIEEEIGRFDEEDELDIQGKVGMGGHGITRASPFQRDIRKSMFRDGAVFAQWMERVHEYGIQEDEVNEVPEFEGDASQSQRTPSPTPSGQEEEKKEDGEEESEEEDEFGNIHIVELQKTEEHLGIHLMHYTSPDGNDLGVFIGAMDENGFAAKSGRLQVQDRILACNGVDFTKETNQRVEQLFLQMTQEPLLRMAISRGLQLDLDELQGGTGRGEEEGESERERVQNEERLETDSPTSRRIASPSNQAPSNTLTNTRQIGVKHTIELTKGRKGFGFGVTSRDVSTDNSSQPIYVKSITTDGPAFVDGRLKLGDRLLEVNGVEVTGKSREEVVQLLREPEEQVTIVISRQQTIDLQEEEEFPKASSQPTTVGKTVMSFEIPLYNSGPAGLGVTVYGKTNLSATSKKPGDMGIYIKSIVPSGAAALDGRLNRNDQLLCINGQSLLGKSNQEALDTLRKALASATGEEAKVQLLVARRVGITRRASLSMGSFSSQMASLGEEPEEEEGDGEVGIDVPPEVQQNLLQSQESSRSHGSLHYDHEPSRGNSKPRTESDLRSARPRTESDLRSARPRTESDLRSARPRTESDSRSPRPRIGSDSRSPRPPRRPPPNPPTTDSSYRSNASSLVQQLRADGGMMGSGEFYDRLEPMEHSTDSRQDHSCIHPTTPTSHYSGSSGFSWHDLTFEREREYSSLDRRGMSRSINQTNDTTGFPAIPPTYTIHTRHHPPSSREGSRVLSPSEVDLALPYSRDESLQRQEFDSRYSPYNSDSASIVSYPMSEGGSLVPTRGSGRRDKPVRGSGRSQKHTPSPALSSLSSDPMSNGFATLPRSNSRSSGHGSVVHSTTPTNPETSSLCSLENYRLSDSETSALRRDDIWRISITKKTKKNPRQDFAHLTFANAEPMVEGEAPTLIRTGSDGCLPTIEDRELGADFLHGIAVGPGLGMVKSSSLESLHNVMQHNIRRDSGTDLRNRETRNSFRRAVDRSYDDSGVGTQQRGVDVQFNGHTTAPAMISFTKSPLGKKQQQQPPPRKKGFLKRVFKKRKGTKKGGGGDKSPPIPRRMRGSSMDAIFDSYEEEEREDTPPSGQYQLHSYHVPTMTSDSRPTLTHRHSMPIIDDTEDSNDEALLDTMARV